MNADGTGQINLSNNPADDLYPDWQRLRAPAPVVGSVLMPASKLAILAPYLVLVGIVGAVAVAVATRGRGKA